MSAHTSNELQRGAMAYVNGRVFTVNESRPWAEAFIVSEDGLFKAVGSTEEMTDLAQQEDLPVHDLQDRFVMPGIHDAHMHTLIAGFSLLSNIELGLDTTSANVADRIRDGACNCSHARLYSGWERATTFMIPDFDRADLDEAFPDTPVYISGGAGHSLYANTALLKKAGYDLPNEEDSQGAVYVRRQDGTLTGEMRELAMTKAALALPKPSSENVKKAIKLAVQQAHKAGVTSIQEASANSAILNALAELEQEDELKVDIFTHVVDAPEHLAGEPRDDLHALIDKASDSASKHVHTSFIKFMLDGVPLPPLHTHASLDENGRVDETKFTVPDLLERMLIHDAKGRTVKVHATGQGSVRTVLDTVQKLRERNPKGPRHEIAHCNSVAESDYPRFRDLRVTAEMSPAFFFTHPAGEAAPELFDWNFPRFLAHDVLTTVGSDWSGSFEVSMFDHLAGVVERIGDGDRALGGERLCRLLTLAGAEAMGRAEMVGSIEVGKVASFVVVDRDLSKGMLEGARVVGTWFEGRRVWDWEREKEGK